MTPGSDATMKALQCATAFLSCPCEHLHLQRRSAAALQRFHTIFGAVSEATAAIQLAPPFVHPSVCRTEVPCTMFPEDGNWFKAEVPYAYEMLAENLADPSHTPYSHHNVIGAAQLLTR